MLSPGKLLGGLFFVSLFFTGCDGGEKKAANEELLEWTGQGAQPENRIEGLKASLYENPDNIDLLSALGDAYFESGKYNKAIREYEKALKINPEDADNLNDRGLAYFYLGEREKGLASVNKAVKSDPSYKHAWLSKGFILLSIGKYEEAVEPLKRVKELDPTGPLGADADNFLARIKSIREQK